MWLAEAEARFAITIEATSPATTSVPFVVEVTVAAISASVRMSAVLAPAPSISPTVIAEPDGFESEMDTAPSLVPSPAAPIEMVAVEAAVAPKTISLVGVVTAKASTASVVFGKAAIAGTVEIRPKPNDATATSAMRFRSVFIDVFFLSISRRQESPSFRLVIQRGLAIAPLHQFLQTTYVIHRNLVL